MLHHVGSHPQAEVRGADAGNWPIVIALAVLGPLAFAVALALFAVLTAVEADAPALPAARPVAGAPCSLEAASTGAASSWKSASACSAVVGGLASSDQMSSSNSAPARNAAVASRRAPAGT